MQQSIIGKIIDNYEITGILGKGGMGVVYKARDMTLDRDVALKMMDANFAADEEFLKRFKSEAKALAKLQNPNIVSVFALRETELGFALVMEFVEGGTLADRIRLKGALPAAQTLPVFAQILTALGDAHGHNVIHRDIKPSNVMLTTDDVVKVTDFGLAKIQHASSATVTMGTGGTLYYMSPEQIRGLSNVDARGDIYSIGMTLYETLTGRVPFGNDAADFTIRQMIVEGKIPSPEKFNPGLPKDIAGIVTKSIHKDPNKRYQTCREMLEALSKVDTRPLHISRRSIAPAAPPPKYKQPPSPRRPLYITLGIGVLLIAGYFSYRLLTPAATTTALAVLSDPVGSQVFVNGKRAGLTPLKDFPVEPGKQTLRVVHDGYSSRDTTVSLIDGVTSTVTVLLAKVPPRGEMTEQKLSSEPDRKEPENTRKPEEGRSKPGRLEAGTSVEMASLTLRSIPPGTISVDGRSQAGSGEDWSTFRVSGSNHMVLFENPKYGSKRIVLNVLPGETKKITCYFETYLSISTSGDAAWGLVEIDGKTTEITTPIDAMAIGPGKHRISVVKKGYETLEGEKIINVEPAFERKVERLAFTLKKK